MSSVGIVGGLGPESTIDYYRRILAAWHNVDPGSAPSILIDSLDVKFGLRLVEHDRPALVEYMMTSLDRLARAGVDFIAISANTPHVVFDDLKVRATVPLLSIVEVCAAAVAQRGLKRILLLGTRFTMQSSFYSDVFKRFAIEVVVPNSEEQLRLHEQYMSELLVGDFRDSTRDDVVSLIERMKYSHAVDSVVLGGTELPLLLRIPEVAGLPMFDTTALHVQAIVERLQNGVI